MSKLDEGKRESEALQAVILEWQRKNGITALGDFQRVSLAHAILCARDCGDAELHDELEELISEHWTCFDDDGSGPECPAASPCPGCAKRQRALAFIGNRPNQAVAPGHNGGSEQ